MRADIDYSPLGWQAATDLDAFADAAKSSPNAAQLPGTYLSMFALR